uniref:S1 RNA-binding domain-containing protein n=2 Tax=Solanum TaxID=4107 RepID=M1BDQ5_SOLTU
MEMFWLIHMIIEAYLISSVLLFNSIYDIIISRQGFEKRVVSQDLQLWLSNAPATGDQFTLLARAGRQVQEIQLTTSLDQEGIKRALQRVLERVP